MISRRTMMLSAPALALWPMGLRAQEAFGATVAAAAGMDQLHALLIAQRGEVRVDRAFRGPATDRVVNVKSVSKTLLAALTGAAVDRGVIALNTTLGEAAPGIIPAGADPRVRALTVEQLVTMTAGLGRTSGPNYGAWVASRNWVDYALTRPFEAEPGARMLYSTGSFHILGAALTEVTGQSLLALARDWLGGPLQIDIPSWTRDPQGIYFGGNEMGLTPQAMLRFGEMARLGGVWQGEQVLSAGWMRDSFAARTRSPYSGLDYGLGWFLGQAGGSPLRLARGYGGQIIAVLPEQEATVVITSDITRPARSEGYFGDLMRLISEVLVPEARAA